LDCFANYIGQVPYRQLHLAPDVWGRNTYDFDPERFLIDKSLVHHPSYRPFGGGNTLCPGRYVARRTVFAVVALLFGRFEVSLDKQNGVQKFPKIDDTKPGLGALAPVPGDDVILVINPRR
jgi:cytochrome P450